MILFLDPEIKKYFTTHANDTFTQIMQLQGQVYRALENRCTQKITLGKKNYFIKQHFGVGWKEIFKNLLQLRLPIISAKNEWLAIQRLQQLGIPTQTIVGFGCRGLNPASRQSFLITEELPPHRSLEELCHDWQTCPPRFAVKQKILHQVAHIARILHTHGMNHRDFYLCHFLLKEGTEDFLYLIDLHRAQMRKKTPARWIIKDVAGLYFSSKNIGLTKRDLLRFMKAYRNQTLRYVLFKELTFWQRVKQRGDHLYQHHANDIHTRDFSKTT